MSIEIVGESTQEHRSVSTQQATTQTSSQQTLQASAELEIGESTNRALGFNQSSIQQTTEAFTQQNAQSSTQQTANESVTLAVVQESTSTQQTTRTSVTDLDIPGSSDEVTLARSSSQYGSVTSERVEDAIFQNGESILESAARNDLSSTQQITQTSIELMREDSMTQGEFGQLSTQRTVDVSTDLTTKASVVYATVQESSIRHEEQDEVMIIQGNSVTLETVREGRVVSESEGENHSSIVDGQTVTEAVQEKTALPFGTVRGLTESMAHVQSTTRETSTALEITTQVSVAEFEQYNHEKSLDIISSVKNISKLGVQETVQVEAIDDENKTVHASAIGVTIQSSEFSRFYTRK